MFQKGPCQVGRWGPGAALDTQTWGARHTAGGGAGVQLYRYRYVCIATATGVQVKEQLYV